MDRKHTLLDLALRLAKAADTSDWSALAAITISMGRILPQLAQQGALSAEESEALLKLRMVHEQTYQECLQARSRLSTTLSGMQAHKEGWMAYALTGATDEDEKQA